MKESGLLSQALLACLPFDGEEGTPLHLPFDVERILLYKLPFVVERILLYIPIDELQISTHSK